MLLDLKRQVADLYGKPMLTPEGKPVSVGYAVVNALAVANGIPVPEKLRAADLAEDMLGKDEYDARVEDIVFIKQIVGPAYPALFVKHLFDILDPRGKSEGSAKK